MDAAMAQDWNDLPPDGDQPIVEASAITIPVPAISQDEEVEICVYRGNAAHQGVCVASAILQLPSKTISVGTEHPVDVASIPYPATIAHVAVYTEQAGTSLTKVIFVLGVIHGSSPQRVIRVPGHIVAQITALFDDAPEEHVIDVFGDRYPTSGLLWRLPQSGIIQDDSDRADHLVWQVRQILHGTRFLGYKRLTTWYDLHLSSADALVVCPGKSVYDMLWIEQGTRFVPGRDDTVWYIEHLKRFKRRYGAVLTGVAHRMIELRVTRTLTQRQRKVFLSELLRFCPNIMQGFPYNEDESLTAQDILDDPEYSHPYFDIRDGRIALWWD